MGGRVKKKQEGTSFANVRKRALAANAKFVSLVNKYILVFLHKVIPNNITSTFLSITNFVVHIVAQYQLVNGYPTLMFFKSGANSSVTYNGKHHDKDSLMDFIDERMDRAPAKLKVRDKVCLAEF